MCVGGPLLATHHSIFHELLSPFARTTNPVRTKVEMFDESPATIALGEYKMCRMDSYELSIDHGEVGVHPLC